MGIAIWLKGMRPQTLPASVAPVVIGATAAWASVRQFGVCVLTYPAPESCAINRAAQTTLESRFWPLAILCVLVALFLQIAVNFANDYSDGVRGTDAGRGVASSAPPASPTSSSSAVPTGTPPVAVVASGMHDGDAATSIHAPARLVASGVPPKRVLAAAGVAAALACLCGLAIIAITGYWWLLIIGVCCLLAGWCYTGGRHPYGYAGLGEVFVFVFFGLVAVLGTQFVLRGTVTATGVLGAVQAGLLSCVLLMVNNLRDIDSDRVHGKRTLAVRLGERRARILAVAAYTVAFVPVAVLALSPLVLSALSLVGLPCWWRTSSWVGVNASGEQESGSSGGWACALPSPPDTLTWAVAAYGVVCLAIAALTIRAMLRRDHARALPLVGLSLLVCAVGYVGLAAI
ncbi:1,4-dihydroxy-2-naphthoate octaprenyltransferase [Bifidobacterium sp. UBA4282]|uniref:1,4-dihydroxy-2-naphthoate octaprenyltransferase n=2 Tax=Bifidobacterium TaxID=1678 RepID=UPI0025BB4DB6|nr:1,4-dihydroxy-2-naphthoate octaprenyltransferase [Bifidobacterium sp. UBA4282]